MLIGEQDEYYEQLVTDCSSMLLSVTGNSMDKAYSSWTSMLSDMETTAADEGFDIKGVKLWINCFWNEDGSIRKIFYYPKPTSKNMDFEQLTTFLEVFSSTYIFPVSNDSCYSHYGSGSFPTARKISVVEK